LLSSLVLSLHGISISFKLYCNISEITFGVDHKDAIIVSGQWIRLTNKNFVEAAILRVTHYMMLILSFYNQGGGDSVVSEINKLCLIIGE